MEEEVSETLNGNHEAKDTGADKPLVGSNGINGGRFEKSVGGVVGIKAKGILYLGHDDRRRHGSRHDKNAMQSSKQRE